MLYVAIGLASMLSIGAFLGFQAIRQATQLVYDERLGTAFSTAAELEDNLELLAHSVGFERGRLLKATSDFDLAETGGDLFAQLSEKRPSRLVRAAALWLLDEQGETRLALPPHGVDDQVPQWVGILKSVRESSLIYAPETDSPDSYFGTLVVPVRDDAGAKRWTIVLALAGISSSEPYLLPSAKAQEGAKAGQPSSSSYGLEVLGPDGRVVLTRMGGTAAGKPSPHWHILQEKASQPHGPFVYLHKPGKGDRFPAHVIAAAPVKGGTFEAILEQREDVALALPLHLRQRLILFASVGFVISMLLAWVTTRHVVKPTERLTAAARRIAAGEVGVPLKVAAQDEIGTLAESLEIMRSRLQAWGTELEKQVRERTSELETRNRELKGLYEALQDNQRQLRSLLGKVLSAQE
jgi:HAMP domain-containing protein